MGNLEEDRGGILANFAQRAGLDNNVDVVQAALRTDVLDGETSLEARDRTLAAISTLASERLAVVSPVEEAPARIPYTGIWTEDEINE